jgi:hypothetical protein
MPSHPVDSRAGVVPDGRSAALFEAKRVGAEEAPRQLVLLKAPNVAAAVH